MENELDLLVQEYLNYREYKQTLSTFKEEAGLNLTSDHRVKDSRKKEKIQQFLEIFKDGRKAEFFELWTDLSSQKEDADVKLEFLLNVYFAILPINDIVICPKEDIRTSMNSFKQFLDSKGGSLCKNDSFLCFYALPYIPEESLKKHPSFQNIFTQEWVQDLELRLVGFLENVLDSDSGSNFPQLIYLYQVISYNNFRIRILQMI
jgi:hypothetical protein